MTPGGPGARETATATADLVAEFASVFDEVGADAVERERTRRLPFAEVERLRASGFTRVTLPVEFGGRGAGHVELFELLAELARRDPNLAQLLRSHFSFVDRALHSGDAARRDRHLRLVADGAIVGNATFEKGPAKVGEFGTRLTEDDDGLRLDGTKFYSTGTLYADVVSVAADRAGETAVVLIPTDAPGVARIDDWNGFGQRLTGSGTTIFDGVRVDEEAVTARGSAPAHSGAFVQLVLLAAATGIGRAIVDDATRFVRARTRTYSHASAALPREDPIVQETIGELSARSFTADAALAAASASLSRAAGAALDGVDESTWQTAATNADVAVTHAQLVILPAVLEAATALFEVGGASALDEGLALDRHWRNARTLASHNPQRYKARSIGEHLLGGAPVVSWWSNGEGA